MTRRNPPSRRELARAAKPSLESLARRMAATNTQMLTLKAKLLADLARLRLSEHEGPPANPRPRRRV